MNYRLLSSFFILLFALSACEESSDDKKYRDIIDQVGNRYAPDKRVAIFNIFLKNGTLYGETNLPEAKSALSKEFESILIDSTVLLKATYGRVNVSVCNIRSEPQHSGELATQALMGMTLRIYKKNNRWSLVQTTDGYLGWLDQGAFVEVTEREYETWKSSKKVVVSKPFDFIYSSLDHTILSDVIEGNILVANNQTEDYYSVEMPDGRSGKIDRKSVVSYEQFLKLKEPLLQNILRTAYSYMGRPYLWGGTSGKAVDCSGFTKTIFYLNGLELQRDASQQVNLGIAVETDTTLQNLLPGDFIFFGRRASQSEKEKITHVAIYLGEGKIIHASDRVQIESLIKGDSDFAPNRLATMVRAKRMLQNIGENGVEKLVDHPLYN